MTLSDIILNCSQYTDSDEIMHMVFAKRYEDGFEPFSEATVLELTPDEMQLDLDEIEKIKCPGYSYFLEINIIQDFFEDIKHTNDYKSDEDKVKRVIHYAEIDA
jgi:hypothetical protein